MLQDRGFLVRNAGGWQLTQSDELPLPETVQGMIAARLDALAPAEKELVQDAAVIGKVFWPAALSALADAFRSERPGLRCTRSSERSSSGGIGARPWQARPSTRSCTHSSAMSRTGRSRARRASTSTVWPPSGSPRSRRTGARTEPRCLRITTAKRSALADAAGVDTTPLRAPAQGGPRRSVGAGVLTECVACCGGACTRSGRALRTGRPAAAASALARRARKHVQPGTVTHELATAAVQAFLAQGDMAHAAEAEALLSWISWWFGDSKMSGLARRSRGRARAGRADDPRLGRERMPRRRACSRSPAGKPSRSRSGATRSQWPKRSGTGGRLARTQLDRHEPRASGRARRAR